MTLDRAVIDLGEREFTPGLSFVAISRVKTLQGLVFSPGFSMARIEQLVTKPGSDQEKNRNAAKKDDMRREQLRFIA